MPKKFDIEIWSESIRPIFPTNANIRTNYSVHENYEIFVDWKLNNDPDRPNKRSTIFQIKIPYEVVEDCQDFDQGKTNFRKFVEGK